MLSDWIKQRTRCFFDDFKKEKAAISKNASHSQSLSNILKAGHVKDANVWDLNIYAYLSDAYEGHSERTDVAEVQFLLRRYLSDTAMISDGTYVQHVFYMTYESSEIKVKCPSESMSYLCVWETYLYSQYTGTVSDTEELATVSRCGTLAGQ